MTDNNATVLQRLMLLAGLVPPPSRLLSGQTFCVDPFRVGFSYAAMLQSAASQATDITANEISPMQFPSGVLKGKGAAGSNVAPIGFIYGLTCRFASTAVYADLNNVLQNVELVITSGNITRSVPLSEMARIQPSTTPALSAGAIPEANASCGAPGTPAYTLRVAAQPWDGMSTAIFGLRVQANFTPSAPIAGEIDVWGIFSAGNSDEINTLVPGENCRGNSLADVASILSNNASLSAALTTSAPMPNWMGKY